MRLLLDMGLSPRTAKVLRAGGHDAVHLSALGFQKLPDGEIANLAAREQRVLITFDLDFARILAIQRLTQPSVVLIRIQQFTTDQVNELLMGILSRSEAFLQEGGIIVVEPDRLRYRTLPIW